MLDSAQNCSFSTLLKNKNTRISHGSFLFLYFLAPSSFGDSDERLELFLHARSVNTGVGYYLLNPGSEHMQEYAANDFSSAVPN